jgi:hypothetical protein
MNDIKGIIEDVEKSSLVSNKVIKKVIEIIGQEKWQEIDDEESDICTTTGELSITLRNITYLEKENAELKKACDETQELLDKQIEATLKLDKENAELKAEWQEQVQKATDEGYARTLQTMQLTKAKELIREIIDTPVFNQMGGELYENEGYTELVEEAEQFLSEVEK